MSETTLFGFLSGLFFENSRRHCLETINLARKAYASLIPVYETVLLNKLGSQARTNRL